MIFIDPQSFNYVSVILWFIFNKNGLHWFGPFDKKSIQYLVYLYWGVLLVGHGLTSLH